MSHCHHIWTQTKKDEESTVNGVPAIRYFHECPKCGRKKETVRMSRKLPPQIKWKREIEKLLASARRDDHVLCYDGQALDLARITVQTLA